MSDALAWMAHEAGLPLIEEDLGGGARPNAAAAGRIGDDTDLLGALGSILEVAGDDPRLVRLVEHARSGARTAERFDRFRALSIPTEDDRARVLMLPLRTETTDGDLAAGVAHELANALGAILGWAELARRRDMDDREVARALERIESGARAARATARHMLEAARGAQPPPQGIDASEVVREVVDLLAPVAGKAEVALHSHVQNQLTVRASEPQLFTIVWNLVENAVQASPAGGVVAVDARLHRGKIRIQVADQGPGISQADRARVFDPYFTTKREGTGLGLALVRRAIESLSGHLTLHSEPGHGSRFAVELPVRTGEARRPAGQPTHKQSGVRAKAVPLTTRILVVEDDRGMREMMVTALELQGAEVVTARNSSEALAAKGPFDLALVDLGLDVRGDSILAELRARGVVDRAALVSGSSAPPNLDRAGEPDAWIRKPFDLEDLLEVVDRLVKRRAEQAATGR